MRFLSLQSLQLVACDKQHILVSQLFSDTVVSFLLSLCGEVSRVGRKLSLQHCTQTHTTSTPILMHSHSFSAPAGRWLVSSSPTVLGRAAWHRSARKSLALRGWAGMLSLSFIVFSMFFTWCPPGTLSLASSGFHLPAATPFFPFSNVSVFNSFMGNEKVKMENTNHYVLRLKQT